MNAYISVVDPEISPPRVGGLGYDSRNLRPHHFKLVLTGVRKGLALRVSHGSATAF